MLVTWIIFGRHFIGNIYHAMYNEYQTQVW